MSGLTEFLLARITEDEERAQAAAERNGAAWSTTELIDGTRVAGTTEFGNPRSYGGDPALWDDEGAMGMFAETAAHVARHDPARVLAECEARRRVVDLLAIAERHYDETRRTAPEYRHVAAAQSTRDALLRAVRFLALPYASHPDYRSEWAP